MIIKNLFLIDENKSHNCHKTKAFRLRMEIPYTIKVNGAMDEGQAGLTFS